MKVMIFTLSSTTPWWRYLASRLEFAAETVVVGELPEADIDLNPAFHRNLRRTGIERDAADALGEIACLDVIVSFPGLIGACLSTGMGDLNSGNCTL